MTERVIRIRNSEKDKQFNGKMKKVKRTNNDIQNITKKITDRATRIKTKTGGEVRCSERLKFLLHGRHP